jgi:hypothetical protein
MSEALSKLDHQGKQGNPGYAATAKRYVVLIKNAN